MRTRRLIISWAFAVTLCAVQCAKAIPTVTINDSTGPIVVNSSGFSTFTWGRIDGNPEAVWWSGTFTPPANLSAAMSGGIWTDPSTKNISDEFAVAVGLGEAGGVFFSDPAVVPASLTLGSLTLPLSLLLGSTSTEPGSPTQISPNSTAVSVIANSSVPDNGTTILMLGFGLLATAGLSSRLRPKIRGN